MSDATSLPCDCRAAVQGTTRTIDRDAVTAMCDACCILDRHHATPSAEPLGCYDVIRNDDYKTQVFGMMNNLFDTDPPNNLPSSYGVTNSVLYDVVGRAFKLGVRVTF